MLIQKNSCKIGRIALQFWINLICVDIYLEYLYSSDINRFYKQMANTSLAAHIERCKSCLKIFQSSSYWFGRKKILLFIFAKINCTCPFFRINVSFICRKDHNISHFQSKKGLST